MILHVDGILLPVGRVRAGPNLRVSSSKDMLPSCRDNMQPGGRLTFIRNTWNLRKKLVNIMVIDAFGCCSTIVNRVASLVCRSLACLGQEYLHGQGPVVRRLSANGVPLMYFARVGDRDNLM